MSRGLRVTLVGACAGIWIAAALLALADFSPHHPLLAEFLDAVSFWLPVGFAASYAVNQLNHEADAKAGARPESSQHSAGSLETMPHGLHPHA